jgi:diguanylate cyclase (GGDEF)-like protein
MNDHIAKFGKKHLAIRQEVLEERIVSHPWILCSTTGIIAIMELFLLIRGLAIPNAINNYHYVYIALYSILFAVSSGASIFTAATAKKAKSLRKAYYILANIYVFTICFFSTGISYLDLVGSLGHPIVFLTTFLAIPCICLINPWVYSLLTVGCSTILLTFVSYVGETTYYVTNGLLINFIIFDIITIFVAFQSYSFMADYYDKSMDLQKLSYTDTLTGLKNRRSLDDMMDSQKQSTDKSMILADIDGFKAINDEHGHQYGDKVLACVGALLKDAFGIDNSFRYGGDEMAISTNKKKEEIIVSIDYINSELSRVFPNDKITIRSSIVLNKQRAN